MAAYIDPNLTKSTRLANGITYSYVFVQAAEDNLTFYSSMASQAPRTVGGAKFLSSGMQAMASVLLNPSSFRN